MVSPIITALNINSRPPCLTTRKPCPDGRSPCPVNISSPWKAATRPLSPRRSS
ncbi:hypothetical protein [Lysobacter gummosus]|uniref:hypothetical protein n=1 Tax=Lysobacter gummosus TaxID=262324 RepID=UPI0036370935